MKSFDFKQLLKHLGVVLFFYVLATAYFSPKMSGNKELRQSDMINYQGMSKEIVDFRESHDEEPLWTNSMFGGMPSYLISTQWGRSFTSIINDLLFIWHPKPMSHVFLYLIGFYICLLAFGARWHIAALGAIAYAFSTYFFIILHAGHVTKAIALGYMPIVIGAVYLALRRKAVLGAILLGLFLTILLATQHMQIVYYTLIIIFFMGEAELYNAYKTKTVPSFVKKILLLIAAVICAVGVNFSNLYFVSEYGKYSMRGESELSNNEHKTSGLDKDYATAWSYGKGETINLLIPNAFGGGAEDLSNDTESAKFFKKYGIRKEFLERFPTYWGPQPFTEGPVYIGAIVIFLFIFGLIILEGRLKWWVLAVTVLSILLAWGKNFMPLTDFFMHYVPGYNKFRTVSMTLIIAQFTMPLLGILALNKILNNEIDKQKILKSLYYAGGGTLLLTLVFALAPGAFLDFEPKEFYSNEAELQGALMQIEQYNVSPDIIDEFRNGGYINNDYLKFPSMFPKDMTNIAIEYLESGALYEDRANLASSDAWRSFWLILFACTAIFLFIKISYNQYLLAGVLTVLILADLWPVAERYLNEDTFVKKKRTSIEFVPTQADLYIKKNNKNHARVLNLTANIFNDAITSYHHHSIGGYHGAKMKRYQEIIDSCLVHEIYRLKVSFNRQMPFQAFIGTPVLNMLNTKYIIVNRDGAPIENPLALGSAWFVDSVKIVESADEEIVEIQSLNTKDWALIDKRFNDLLSNFKTENNIIAIPEVNGDYINKTAYKPNHITYECNAMDNRIAIFSEIYYPEGWNAYVDGVKMDYFRSNYILRGMVVPKGKHTIEFKFEPNGFAIGKIIKWIFSGILFFGLLLYAYFFFTGKEDKILKI